MRSSERTPRLSERDREVLRDVVYQFIAGGEPVSSRSVARRGRLGLSSASIRNVMADLEELGYLRQPHTSAGRVPTASGYHLYIEGMMRSRGLTSRERRYIDNELSRVDRDGEERMSAVTHLLSDLSRQVGIVVTPAVGETVLRSIDFVPVAGRKVLCVVVSASGFVDHKLIETTDEISREDLIRAGNYLTQSFGDRTLREIRDQLVALMDDERAQLDRLLALAVELARRGLPGDEPPAVLFDGATSLLSQPELADLERVRRLFDTFTDKARLVRILNQCLLGPGVRVFIGEESEVTSELDFSLVAASYGTVERPLGTLGIFGPSRMEYERVIPLVEYLAGALSQALEETFGR